MICGQSLRELEWGSHLHGQWILNPESDVLELSEQGEWLPGWSTGLVSQKNEKPGWKKTSLGQKVLSHLSK